jgi:hypothetical protein
VDQDFEENGKDQSGRKNHGLPWSKIKSVGRKYKKMGMVPVVETNIGSTGCELIVECHKYKARIIDLTL